MDFEKIQLHNVDLEDLETKDGDSLNLKSRLCQMLGLSTILSSTEIGEAWVRCTNKNDESMIFRFNLYGEMPN